MSLTGIIKIDTDKETIREPKDNLKISQQKLPKLKKRVVSAGKTIPGTQEPWNNIKLSIFTIGMPEGEKRKMDRRNI